MQAPAQKAELSQSKSLAWEVLFAALFCFAVFGCYSLSRGQDVNWDQQNYHFYAGTFLHSRLAADFFASGYPSYLNQFPYLLFRLLVVDLPPRTVGFILGGIHGLNCAAVYLLSRLLVRGTSRGVAMGLALVSTAAGAVAPMFLSEVGTSFADILFSPLIVLALAAAYTASHRASGYLAWTGIAGLALGLVGGMKLTNLCYLVGAVAAIFASGCGWRRSRVVASLLCVVAAAGFLMVDGGRCWAVWREYGNPFFPFYNKLFRSEYFQTINFRDERGVPRSCAEALKYPFDWARGISRTAEVPFRDARTALLHVPLAFGLLAWVYARIRRRPGGRRGEDGFIEVGGRRFLISFYLVSYAMWLSMFAVHRFIVPLELLAGLALLAAWDAGPLRARVKTTLFLVSAMLIIWSVRVPDWAHIAWQAEWYGVRVPAERRVENATYVLMSRPIGWLIPYFPSSSRFVSIKGPVSLNFTEAARQRIRSLIEAGNGGRFTLGFQDEYQSNRHQYDEWLRSYGYRLATEGCLMMESRLRPYVSCPLVPIGSQVYDKPGRRPEE
jgi:hypothetical protein